MTTVLQTEGAKKNRYLIFKISDDLYGLEVSYLKEVFQSGNILKLPRTSAVLEGIVNLRGYIISIFNLSILLWGTHIRKEEVISNKKTSKSNVILLLTIKEQDVGVLVDQIIQLDTITDFVAKDESYFQGRELLNPSLISQIGFLDDKQPVFLLDLEGLLGSFIITKKPSKKEIKAEEDFDFDQYTLPDPEKQPEDKTMEDDASFDLNQLNLPEIQLTDKFDQTILDMADVERKKEEKKEKPKTKKKNKAKKTDTIKKDLKKADKTTKTVKAKKSQKGGEKGKEVDEIKPSLKEADEDKKTSNSKKKKKNRSKKVRK